MEIVNLTPHPVRIVGIEGKEIEIKPSGVIARVTTKKEKVGEIEVEGIKVPIYKTIWGEVEGLPESDGRIYIVSSVVASRLRGREDVVVPDDFVRDERGNIIGAKSFRFDS